MGLLFGYKVTLYLKKGGTKDELSNNKTNRREGIIQVDIVLISPLDSVLFMSLYFIF
jgi:hypothetical protein